MGSNPASWVRIPPRPLEQFPTRQVEDACPRGFEPSDLWSRARRVPRSGRKPTPPLPPRKFDSGSPLGAPSPAARTGRFSSLREHPGSRHPERWQNGNAPVSKTGALTGLGVRIPPSPLRRGSNRATSGRELGESPRSGRKPIPPSPPRRGSNRATSGRELGESGRRFDSCEWSHTLLSDPPPTVIGCASSETAVRRIGYEMNLSAAVNR